MGHNRNYSNLFYDYSIPTFFLDGNISITNKDIVIELGAGSFTLDYNILLHYHNVTLKGAGEGRTFLIINQNIDYYDDSLINLIGEEGDEISVSISDLTIQSNVTQQQANSRNYKLTQNESFLIKCYHVKSFEMRNVTINVENIETTCLNIRRGFNIEIRDCTFINYNRRCTGGGIWLQGDLENITIEDNDFYKYGNDEVIAVWGSNNFVGVNDADFISKKDINICYNRIYCQDANGGENANSIITENGDDWDGNIRRFITFYTNQDDNKEYNAVHEKVPRATPCRYTLNGIHMNNNEIHLNSPLTRLITASFDEYTTFKDVSFQNNIITYGTWAVESDSESPLKELIDFSMEYTSDENLFSDEPFLIKGNTITCGSNVRNEYVNENIYKDNHMCANIRNAKVVFTNNLVKCTRGDYTTDEQSYGNKGIEMFRIGNTGGEVIFVNNRCEGIKGLATITSSVTNGIQKSRVKGINNYLYGDTRITHKNALESHELMIGNEIISDYPIFFDSGFAKKGTAIFTNNRVYRDLTRVTRFTTPYGHIYYGQDYDIVSVKLVCCDNIFDNLNQNAMYSYLHTNIRIKHANNVFTDLIE